MKLQDPYLPIKSSKGEPDLVSYSGCSERYLRKKIQSKEIRSWRARPGNRILVRTSWFDEFVGRKMEAANAISEKAKRFVDKLLAR